MSVPQQAATRTPGHHEALPEPPPADLRVIRPTKKRVVLADLWRSRAVIYVLTARDFKTKFKQSVLGQLWLLIQPLGMLLAFTVVFNGITEVDTSGIPYSLFALTGLTVWSFTQLSLITGVSIIVSNDEFVRRVAFPRVALPVTALLRSLPALVATFVFTLVTIFASGYSLGVEVLALPLALAWLFVFCLSCVLLLSAVTVRFRDPINMLPFVLQVALFISPIAYSTSQAEGWIATLINLNPISGLVDAWRWVLLGLEPGTFPLIASLVWTTVLAVAGWQIFTRSEVTFADDI